MKKLSLDETWRLCLKMWRWIANEIKAGNLNNVSALSDVSTLKEKWVKKHKFEKGRGYCLFCEYVLIRSRGCCFCPATKVDEAFHCTNNDYNYDEQPIKFYKKLLQLNKIRLAKAKKEKKLK